MEVKNESLDQLRCIAMESVSKIPDFIDTKLEIHHLIYEHIEYILGNIFRVISNNFTTIKRLNEIKLRIEQCLTNLYDLLNNNMLLIKVDFYIKYIIEQWLDLAIEYELYETATNLRDLNIL